VEWLQIALHLSGKLIRNSSLGFEIPQVNKCPPKEIWALVWTQTLLEEYLICYTWGSNWKRHLVKPGVTGLGQINGRNAISWEKKFGTWSLVYYEKSLQYFFRYQDSNHHSYNHVDPEGKGNKPASAHALLGDSEAESLRLTCVAWFLQADLLPFSKKFSLSFWMIKNKTFKFYCFLYLSAPSKRFLIW